MDRLEEIYLGLAPWIQNIVIVAGAIVGGLLLKAIVFSALRISITKNKEAVLRKSLLNRCTYVLNYLVPVIVLSFSLPLMEMSEKAYMYVEKTLEVLLIIGFAWLAIKVVYVIQDSINESFDIEAENNFLARKVRTQVQFLKKLLIIGVVVITLSILLLNFESVRSIGAGLLTSAGVTGIIIGFAAQKSIANLIAGFQIAFTQPIRIDDVVIVEGEFGRVEEITLTYVVLRLWDQRRLVVPINYFIENSFQNWTRQNSNILGTVFLYTDYFIPFDALRREIERLCQESPYWDKNVCVLQVTDTTETALQLRVLVSAANAGNAWELRVYLREKLVEFIRDHYPEALPKTRAEAEFIAGPNIKDAEIFSRNFSHKKGIKAES